MRKLGIHWQLTTLALAWGCSASPTTDPTVTNQPAPSATTTLGAHPHTTTGTPAEVAPASTIPAKAHAPAPSASLYAGESAIVEALRSQPVAQVVKGRGGRSLAFKVTLADGTVGYFKPEQSFSAAHFYSELASYYLDRELGIGRVPPTTGRRLSWAPLREAAGGDKRIAEIVVREDGTVRGALIWWIPLPLVPIRPPRGWTRWLRVSGPLPVNPYQRPREWSADTNRGGSAGAFEEPERPATPQLPRELSTLIAFDFLTSNVDRWGGNFTNVRTLDRNGPLIYLDNGAGFTPGPTATIPLMEARLYGLERFEEQTVETIRAFERTTFERRMQQDPLWPFLSERQFEQLEARRQLLLQHVATLRGAHGAAVTAWQAPGDDN